MYQAYYARAYTDKRKAQVVGARCGLIFSHRYVEIGRIMQFQPVKNREVLSALQFFVCAEGLVCVNHPLEKNRVENL